MDTVSMLNKMSFFYCQPILPLVYDESLSYYETLCKFVGQLNTTGDAVNKLNEGLTGEIADRQAADEALDERLTGEISERRDADAALDERLTRESSDRYDADAALNNKLTSEVTNRYNADSLLDGRLKAVEDTNKKIHFLIFAGTPPHNAQPVGAMPTRSELRQWINAGDMIVTLLETNDEERNQIYATSCAYNAVNWTHETPADFYIIVPISTDYDSEGDYAVRQKIAKITIPPDPASSLNEKWGLQVIEINTPSTTAEGVVNLAASISDDGAVSCSITPSEFLGLYNITRGGKNLCVAVNAKLDYDERFRSSSIATVDTTNRKIRIAFEREGGVYTENGVKQLNTTFDYIVGDANTNTWTHESIDTRTLDLKRYEGFQFTRGAGNVITADDESTPNAVYAQYHSDTSGKIYQNLPVRLIDTVDNAEYWNGVFDIKDNKHMTFTFVTSNALYAPGKMLVHVIELSADVNTTTWKYSEKEFTLPLEASNDVVTYTASKVGEGEYLASGHRAEYQVDFAEGIPAIINSIEAGKKVIFRVDLKEIDSVSGATPVYFASGYTKVTLIPSVQEYIFAGDVLNGNYNLNITTGLEHAILMYHGETLPMPNPDGTDNGKVPTVNGKEWELKALPNAATVDTAMSDTSTNAVQNKVIKKYVDDYIAAPVDTAMSDTSINAVPNKVIKKYVDDGLSNKAPSGDYVTNAELNEKGYLTLDTLPKYGGETA